MAINLFTTLSHFLLLTSLIVSADVGLSASHVALTTYAITHTALKVAHIRDKKVYILRDACLPLSYSCLFIALTESEIHNVRTHRGLAYLVINWTLFCTQSLTITTVEVLKHIWNLQCWVVGVLFLALCISSKPCGCKKRNGNIVYDIGNSSTTKGLMTRKNTKTKTKVLTQKAIAWSLTATNGQTFPFVLFSAVK